MIEGNGWRLHHGDCRAVLASWPDESVDSIVCDPPYELGFMGKKWDSTGIAYQVELWVECLRVLKPGGHLLAFGGTRTYHRMACAIEDAGFEIRDSIHWLYGSGFPKSLDVSKAIDKAAGAERKVIGTSRGVTVASSDNQYGGINRGAVGIKQTAIDVPVTVPATDEARQWAGYGTALKPAHEPIVVARKPLARTVASNVLEFGTGAINIDGCRVPGKLLGDPMRFAKTDGGSFNKFSTAPIVRSEGRWPANVVLDELVAEQHPEWAHYFYCAKAARSERNAGLDHLEEKTAGESTGRKDSTAGLNSPGAGAGRTGGAQNHHPTVKPVELMRWLVRLVTPPDGTVVDPFAGSGATLVAAILEGRNVVGVELTDDYLPIIEGRCRWAEEQMAGTLFGGVS